MAAAVDTAPILGSATLSHATRHPKTTHDPEPKPAKQDKKLSAYVTVPSRLSLGGKTEYDEAFLPFVRSDAYGDLGCGTLNRWEQARLAVLTVLVLPIKLIMFFLIVFSFYLYCKLSLLLPPRLRRRCIRPAGKLAARSAMFSLGFLRVTWIKSQDGPDPPYAAIVGNHSSPVDIFLCMSHYFPSFLSKTAVANYPMIGPIAQCMDCVFVDITSKAEKDQGMGMSTFVKQRIESVLQPGSDLLPMCVFPEGTTSNGKYLMPFKAGAFLAGLPLKPIIIHYATHHVSPTYDSLDLMRLLFLVLANPTHAVTVQELPVYTPSPEEQENPRLFAENVRQYMLRHSNLQPCTSSLKEQLEYMALLKEKAKARKYE